MPTMHVLHLETGRHLYGGARQVLYLSAGLGERGLRNTLVCASGSAVERAARAQGIEVLALPMAGDADLRLLWRFAQLCRRLKPTLVHVHSRRGADSWGLLAAKLAGLPVVLSRRVDHPASPLLRWRYRLCDRVIAISGAVEAQLRADGVTESRLRLVRSAVPLADPMPRRSAEGFRQAFGLSAEDRPVAVVAQMIPRKGHRTVIESLPAMLAGCPRLRLVLFGQGSLQKDLRRSVRAAGLADCVQFAGFREDLADYLGHFELLLHPAGREALGVALLEAQAAGVPVVGFRVPGVNEAVADGDSGLLVPPGDVDALAAAVVGLLGDDGRRRAMGEAGRRRMAAGFSIDAMLEGNLAVYRELFGSTA